MPVPETPLSLIKKHSSLPDTSPAAPAHHPQTTYPQHNPQQLWESLFLAVQKVKKNRDLFKKPYSCHYWSFIDQSPESHGL